MASVYPFTLPGNGTLVFLLSLVSPSVTPLWFYSGTTAGVSRFIVHHLVYPIRILLNPLSSSISWRKSKMYLESLGPTTLRNLFFDNF